MLIIPKPKVFHQYPNNINLNRINYLYFKGYTDQEKSSLIKALDEDFKYPIKFVNDSSLANIIIINKQKDEEAYQITTKGDIIEVLTGSNIGVFYALKTLKQLINHDSIPQCFIDDAPDLKVRGLMLDISRSKVLSVKTIKEIIDLMADLKYNHLQLYVEGFSFEYKSFPEVLEKKNYISLDEYLIIEEYAKERYIDLVPNQNGFGHMSDWLRRLEYKDLAECPEGFYIWGAKRPPSTLDPTNPQSFNLVKKMYEDMLPYSTSKFFNMNFDEPYELGYGKSKAYCEKKGKENVFIEYFEKLADVVRYYGKRPMIWGDVLIKHPEAIKKLPKDVIFIDWGYSLDYPFHQHLKTLQKANLSFMAAAGTSTWSVITSRYQDMLGSIRNAALYTKQYGGEGILVTDWGDVGHLQYLPFSLPGFIYGALSSWNVYENYEYLIHHYLSKYLNDSELAGLIIDMSNYTRLEGEYRSYGSRLFSAVLWAEHCHQNDNPINFFLNRMETNLLNIKQIKSLKYEFNNFQKRLDLITVSKKTHLVKDELANALHLLQTLLDLNLCLGKHNLEFKEINFEKIINDLETFQKNHKKLWDKRNHPAGYDDSSRRIKQLIFVLENLKERRDFV